MSAAQESKYMVFEVNPVQLFLPTNALAQAICYTFEDLSPGPRWKARKRVAKDAYFVVRQWVGASFVGVISSPILELVVEHT